MKRRAVAAALILASGCATVEAKPAYLVGRWGGPHAAIAFDVGLAEVRFDCASGSMDLPVFPAKDGAFQVKGTYRQGSPGPVRVGQIFRTQPATYSGTVIKEQMTLNVELEDGTLVGPFTLTMGAPGQLTRCL
jgi:hypothetical protein